jgi:hypothetical protein
MQSSFKRVFAKAVLFSIALVVVSLVGFSASATTASADCKTCKLDTTFDADCVDAPSGWQGKTGCTEPSQRPGQCELDGFVCYGSGFLATLDLDGTFRLPATDDVRQAVAPDGPFSRGCNSIVVARTYSETAVDQINRNTSMLSF